MHRRESISSDTNKIKLLTSNALINFAGVYSSNSSSVCTFTVDAVDAILKCYVQVPKNTLLYRQKILIHFPAETA